MSNPASERGARGHEGWLKTMGTCEARGEVGHLEQLPGPDICVKHRVSDGKAYSWDDVSGAELKCDLVVKTRKEEMGQFKERGAHERVK